MSFSDRLAKFGLTARDARTSVFKATMLLSAIAVWCALTASLAMSSDSPSLKGVAWSVSQGQKDGVTANIYSGIRSALLEIQSSNVGDLKTPLDCSDSADDCSVYVISTKTVQWKDTDCPDFSDGEHCDACDAAADSTWTAALSGIVTTALSLYTTYSRMYHCDSLDKKVMGITSALTAFSAMLYSIMRYSNDCYGTPPESIKELAMSFDSVLGPGWYLMLLACVCKAFVSLVHLVTPVLVEIDQDTLAADLLNEAHRLPAVPARKFAPQARTVAARRAAPLQATNAQQMAGVAAAGAVALGSMGAPALAGDIGNGEGIFSGNCAACHAGGNNVIAAEKTLKQEALKEYLAGGFSEKSIVYQVTNGKNAMPAFGGRLGDDEIADVAAYVYDTAANDAWE